MLLFMPFSLQAHDTRQLVRAIETSRPAVVKIVVSKPASSARAEPEALKAVTDSFRSNFPEIFFQGSHSRFTGSGLLVEIDNKNTGYIASSAHLLQGARNITVELADGKSVKAGVLGFDHDTDIVLLKVPLTKDMPLPGFAALETVHVGQPVYAIGAPFGFSASVTAGIVSAIRNGPGFMQNNAVIQSDVAVNPGNSGGPLFNYEGEVIGITTQIMSTNGGFQGISFAVSMNSVLKAIARIKKTAGSGSGMEQ